MPDYVLEYAADAVAFAAAILPANESSLPLLSILEILRDVLRWFPPR